MSSQVENQKITTEKKTKAKAILKFSILVLLILGIPAYIFLFHRDILTEFTSVEQLEGIIEEYKGLGYIAIVFFQALQIVISILPSQWIQIAGAYAYGFWITAILSLGGTIIGSIIAYYLAKLLGRDALYVFFKREKVEELIEKLNSKRAMIFIAVIYFIPGLPKDLCNYAAGISNMNLIMFLVISTVARTPAMMASILVGNEFGNGNYTTVIIVSVVMVILFILGAIFRHKVFAFVDKIYDKLTRHGETEDQRQARVELEKKQKKAK